MKLPNGYGSIEKLSGTRRKPFMARLTTGWDDTGKQQRHIVGYYKTRKEALQALADYHNDPYDLVSSKLSFADMYHMWSESFFTDETNRSTKKNYTNAYKFCTSLYDMRITDIKLIHLQNVIDNSDCGADTKKRIKILFNKIFDYCIKYEYVTKNYANLVTVPQREHKTTRCAISTSDIEKIWKYSKSSYTGKIALILIYSGVRINELLNLKKDDLFMDEQYFNVVHSKTSSGVRVVPIADKVLPLWKSVVENSKCEYAITNSSGEKMTDDNFRRRYWSQMLDDLGINYTIHETRHTCVSLLTTANINPTIIKHIVGHKSTMSLTESVYTHFELQPLLDAINSI